MGFYDLGKEERAAVALQIQDDICRELQKKGLKKTLSYCSDADTYIRKNAYLAIGKIYKEHIELRQAIISMLNMLLGDADCLVRQSCINAAGEIGKWDFEIVAHFFDAALFDAHHAVRNAVIGSVKKMGEKNPGPVLKWARKYLHHEDKEIRREICHGIELRGRTHPQDILPMLQELQFDKTARVRNTLVHVIGQIAYKKGCLATVIESLNKWENKDVVVIALTEIRDVHDRYRNFAVLTPKEAAAYINKYATL